MKEPNAMRLKVAYVSNSAQGEYTGRLRWLPILRERGIDVTFLLPGGEPQAVARFTAAGVDTVVTSLTRGIANPAREVRAIRELVACFSRGGFQIIHAFGHRANISTSIAAKFCRGPILFHHITGLGSVFTADRFSLSNRTQRLALQASYRALSARTAAVFFQNPDDLREFGCFDPDRCIMTAGTGVDLDEFDPSRVDAAEVRRIRSSLAATDDDVVITYVGRLLRHKGVEELLAAAADLIADGQPIILLIIGQVDRGNETAISSGVLARYRDQGRIRVLGRRDDIKSLLAASDVFVNPSYREGLPRTNIEAAAMGCPIVTTDVPGCRLTVEHGENGLLVPPRDPRRLREALAALVSDPARRREMSQRSRVIAANRFSVRDIATQIADVYWATYV